MVRVRALLLVGLGLALATALPLAAALPSGTWEGPGTYTFWAPDGTQRCTTGQFQYTVTRSFPANFVAIAPLNQPTHHAAAAGTDLCGTLPDQYQDSSQCTNSPAALLCSYGGPPSSSLNLTSEGLLQYEFVYSTGARETIVGQLAQVMAT